MKEIKFFKYKPRLVYSLVFLIMVCGILILYLFINELSGLYPLLLGDFTIFWYIFIMTFFVLFVLLGSVVVAFKLLNLKNYKILRLTGHHILQKEIIKIVEDILKKVYKVQLVPNIKKSSLNRMVYEYVPKNMNTVIRITSRIIHEYPIGNGKSAIKVLPVSILIKNDPQDLIEKMLIKIIMETCCSDLLGGSPQQNTCSLGGT